eukprot:GFYU01003237.1.p1 GENE.GFYU01003237.1~~GFYU01003237.1.p1  ORF type:complete len:171 (-),score=34.95 GFYU01003237.1:165-677(-)
MTFAQSLKEDKFNIGIVVFSMLGFIISLGGLSTLPTGDVLHKVGNAEIMLKVPSENVHLQWVMTLWSAGGAAMVLIGSGLRRRDILLMAMAFNTMVATCVTVGAHLLTEATYNCRNCDLIPGGECPSFITRCENGYNAFMVGTIFINLTQYLFLASCSLRRKQIKDSVHA